LDIVFLILDQVGNGERNLADSGLGGRKNNSFTGFLF